MRQITNVNYIFLYISDMFANILTHSLYIHSHTQIWKSFLVTGNAKFAENKNFLTLLAELVIKHSSLTALSTTHTHIYRHFCSLRLTRQWEIERESARLTFVRLNFSFHLLHKTKGIKIRTNYPPSVCCVIWYVWKILTIETET